MLSKFFFLFVLAGLVKLEASLSPQVALTRLMKGNTRYCKGRPEQPNRTEARRKETVNIQEPFAVIVGCSDSRVPPEILFDEGIGDLFVVRVAGNVIGPLEQESINFGVLDLKASIIVVLGHENCGAVEATLAGKAQGMPSVANLIQPALDPLQRDGKKPTLEEAVKANAARVRQTLLKNPAFENLIKEGRLQIYAAYYRLDTGCLEWFDPYFTSPAFREAPPALMEPRPAVPH